MFIDIQPWEAKNKDLDRQKGKNSGDKIETETTVSKECDDTGNSNSIKKGDSNIPIDVKEMDHEDDGSSKENQTKELKEMQFEDNCGVMTRFAGYEEELRVKFREKISIFDQMQEKLQESSSKCEEKKKINDQLEKDIIGFNDNSKKLALQLKDCLTSGKSTAALNQTWESQIDNEKEKIGKLNALLARLERDIEDNVSDS